MNSTEKQNNKRLRVEFKYLYDDLCVLILIATATWMFYREWMDFVEVNNQTGHLTGMGNILMSVGIFVVLYFVTGRWFKAFSIGEERKANLLASQLMTLFVTDFLEIFISCAITGQFRFWDEFLALYARTFIIVAVINCILLIIMASIYRRIFPPLTMIEIYGETHNSVNTIYRKLNEVPYKYNVTELMSCDEDEEKIREKIKSFDAVLINDLPARKKNRMLKICFDLNKRIYFVPKISDILVKNSEELNLFDTPIFYDSNHGMNVAQRFVKRFFDIVLSGLALIVLSPLMIVTAIAIHAEDGGPVFFRQERVTRGGRHFMIFKFRSMIVDAEKDGRPHPAGEKDDRITRVGNVIRAYRIDELPQLFNIIKGDMSIVGPRPERWEHCEKYRAEIPEWDLRNKVRGGLTGYAQVYGKYDTDALSKLKMDLIYITNYSILQDIQIIFQTVKILFRKESTEGFSEDQAMEMHDAEVGSSKEDQEDECGEN